jgi:hypothetical protein
MLTPLSSGQRELSANYAGNTHFEASSGTASHIVRADTQLDLVSVAPSPTPIGDSATVTLALAQESNLDAASGTLQITTDREGASCQIVLPQTSCSLTLSANGLHQIRAFYPGDGNYLAASDTQAHVDGQLDEIFASGFESP